MRIDFGGFAAFVSQQFLNIPEVGSRLQQMDAWGRTWGRSAISAKAEKSGA